MSSCGSSIDYCVSQTEEDLQQILELQQANHASTLSPEELKSEGFVSAQHDLEILRKMHQEYPHILAKVTVNGESTVVGYALCMNRSAEEHIEILSGLFSTIDTAQYRNKSLAGSRYFVMGQICIAKSYRGQHGVFGGLYRHMRTIMAPHFEYVVTSVATRNPRSLRAHIKVGFEIIHQYSSFGQDWNIVLWDWKDPNSSCLQSNHQPEVKFTVAAGDKDLKGILTLQEDNLLDSLSPTEMESQGFVSAKHDLETLRIMQWPHPHVIARACLNDKNHQPVVVGYTLAMLQSHEPLIPMAKGICAHIDASEYQGKSMVNWNYCIVGQVCVHKDFRGKGVFRGLYEKTKEIMSPHFDCIVAAVSTKNKRSLQAHAKLGFTPIRTFNAVGQDWKIVLWDWKV
ncbi:acetyltransferase [Nitzschia inconspicua]|uniref:Acetyltransferase n=1 Tax=Nitzschia inconspicua TaxID=303405 RepID=A0A9K3K7V1_9STRA|nr:acyl-CoA N-acyltransferase [Nitzschia inconspicua]KAG7374883.1 acetyltransferase [Nitzschia inconspicua]